MSQPRIPAQTLVALLQQAVEFQKTGRLAQAERIYLDILKADAREFNALQLLGVLKGQQGLPEEALGLMRKALKQNPKSAEIHNNLGVIFNDLFRHEEAIASLRRALAIRPDYADAHCNLGNALNALGRHEEASASSRRALALKPHYAEAQNNLGNALLALHRFEDAAASYRQALTVRPDLAQAHLNMAFARLRQGRAEEAVACCRNAVAVTPSLAKARWAIAMYQLPPVFDTPEQVDLSRNAFSRELSALSDWFDAGHAKDGPYAVGNSQPFFLAYQEENNLDLLNRYGDLCARLMKHWFDEQKFAPVAAGAGSAVRLGVVSAHVRNHSVWNAIVKGWIRHLDRGRIEVRVFHMGPERDQETSQAKSRASYSWLPTMDLRECVATILASRCDVLVYPEIGMHEMTTKLASLRLAPVQAASWGHPETTGLPTIDYFLSAEDFEPPAAEENYRERLVKLPRLGCCYERLSVHAGSPELAGLTIDADIPVLLSPGNPFKYAPRHDWVFPEIARRIGRCRLVFFTRPEQGMSDRVQPRIRSAFATAGLDFDEYGLFIPWQKKPGFYGLLQRADVFLDTIGFSGFNTAMQAVECSVPIVTREGRFMRGRLASGILKRMGLSELVAASEHEYVALAVRLAQDVAYRKSVRERIENERGALFEDMGTVRALEDFLVRAAGRK